MVLALFLSTKADDQVTPITYAVGKTLVVDQSGHANFTNIQNALDSITSNNQNTCNLEPGKLSTWAPAALINADKASFYRCGFVSVQDTLTDSEGRHYF
ncbi:hypothetical protein V6N13_136417 [Hibiscus sabdariffa]